MSAIREKILLLMSGGVDSSVAALLLREIYDIIGVTMKIPNSDAHKQAQNAAKQLGVFHVIIESEKIFTELIINKFINSRKLGMTPNPCADCNKALKFGLIPELAEKMLGITNLRIATGHYVSISGDIGHKYLCRASDIGKDQSYFLCDLPSGVVQKLIFPLGTMNKREVKEMARKANIEAVENPESMDSCFSVPSEVYIENARGNIIGTDGKIIGEHKGIANYTIGQRHGLGIAAKEPLYVLSIDAAGNSIVAGTQTEAFKRNVHAINTNNLSDKTLDSFINKRFFGKTRSRGEPSPCKIIDTSQDNFSVEFEAPHFAPTPGQRLVCYDENGAMLLSGVISSSTT